MISRRNVLLATASTLLMPNVVLASTPSTRLTLTAEPVAASLMPSKKPTALWGFNGSTPGPLIRVKKGARVRARFVNAVKQESAIHWHGIRIDNQMDGVPGLTQEAVKPGGSFEYDFVVPDSGTYWYHSHNRSWEQVARGLYGALIVEEENPPRVDHDITVFIDDWLLRNNGDQVGDFDNRHKQAHGGRLGNFFKAIFLGAPRQLKRNERIRLRLINAATDRVFPIQIGGVEGKIVAFDGMPLAKPEPLRELVLAPAQRSDIIVDVIGGEMTINTPTRNGRYRLGTLTTDSLTSPRRQNDVQPLEANIYTMPDIDDATPQLTLTMEGGAMSFQGMKGMMGGEEMMEMMGMMGMMRMMGMKGMKGDEGMMGDDIWGFNGKSGITEKPFYQFERGRKGVIDLVNDTRFAHAIHLHGHHFRVVKSGNTDVQRDTILIAAGEHQKIACVFDNPGKWLLHCHMLGHQASGMKTWINVV